MRALALLAILSALGAYGFALGAGAQAPRDVWSELAAEAAAFAKAKTTGLR